EGEGGSGPTLIRAVKTKLFTLPEETVIYPGHGPPSTIGDEKAYNPFFQPGAEQYLGFSV
ncbi:MAG: beta-lactamase protein, partial [Dehalococcoidia bacterium]|nr:beta-lactamase protein [Dehalococcoidia bacterium]